MMDRGSTAILGIALLSLTANTVVDLSGGTAPPSGALEPVASTSRDASAASPNTGDNQAQAQPPSASVRPVAIRNGAATTTVLLTGGSELPVTTSLRFEYISQAGKSQRLPATLNGSPAVEVKPRERTLARVDIKGLTENANGYLILRRCDAKAGCTDTAQRLALASETPPLPLRRHLIGPFLVGLLTFLGGLLFFRSKNINLFAPMRLQWNISDSWGANLSFVAAGLNGFLVLVTWKSDVTNPALSRASIVALQAIFAFVVLLAPALFSLLKTSNEKGIAGGVPLGFLLATGLVVVGIAGQGYALYEVVRRMEQENIVSSGALWGCLIPLLITVGAAATWYICASLRYSAALLPLNIKPSTTSSPPTGGAPAPTLSLP